MTLNIQQERVDLFIKLYREEFEETLTQEEAEMMIKHCLSFMIELMEDLPVEVETGLGADSVGT